MNVERATRTRLRTDSFTQVSSVTHETSIILDIEMLQKRDLDCNIYMYKGTLCIGCSMRLSLW